MNILPADECAQSIDRRTRQQHLSQRDAAGSRFSMEKFMLWTLFLLSFSLGGLVAGAGPITKARLEVNEFTGSFCCGEGIAVSCFLVNCYVCVSLVCRRHVADDV